MESMSHPGKYYRNNVGSTIALLEAMRDHGVKKLVFSSTCATYGNPLSTPITEKHPLQPINPYGRSKRMNEEIIHDFEMAHGIEAVILRYFNAAGADLETQIGENHSPETHLIPLLIQAALGLRSEVVVYGTDFDSRDGSAVRDYIHVQDLADAHVASLKISPHTINLGTGTGYSVLELISAVEKFCGKSLPIRLENRRPGEPGVLTADNTKAKEILAWHPKVSDLPTLIESAWKWHQLLFEHAPLLRSVLNSKAAFPEIQNTATQEEFFT
jgi:UDP-glucose-4-epimerase GalE